ncbi:MAG: stage 0 sporulation family protein [Candidatus Omnitrophica bacterium]|nr:stage 0 sporulation family protein [Candidatus Omnitrophota bacterium]
MEKIIEIKIREYGPVVHVKMESDSIKPGERLILEQDRGLDYACVIAILDSSPQPGEVKSSRKVLRRASDADLRQIENNKKRAKEALNTCVSKIKEHKLSMKLVGAEFSFDASKIIFYFTAEGRVDFRNLVKDLAKIFKVRIELKQIGVRDEAKLFGGIGPCGRRLCCAAFLKNFEPVSIKMAKEEGLPLNPPKISGICGRLMCCLSYEYEVYKTLSRGLPRQGEKLHTPQGKGKVISVDIFKRIAVVELEDGKQIEVNYKHEK